MTIRVHGTGWDSVGLPRVSGMWRVPFAQGSNKRNKTENLASGSAIYNSVQPKMFCSKSVQSVMAPFSVCAAMGLLSFSFPHASGKESLHPLRSPVPWSMRSVIAQRPFEDGGCLRLKRWKKSYQTMCKTPAQCWPIWVWLRGGSN